MVPLSNSSPASLKGLFILSLSTLVPLVAQGHSWLDCTDTRDNGACIGFPLGYPSRNDIDINTKYTYLVQNRRADASVCQPGRQNIAGNNPFPPANVVPGQELHLTWQPDGHLDDNKPSTVEIHWSGVPGKQLLTRSELSDATRVASMIFATSRNCDQPGEPNTWCHGRFRIPEAIQPGTYQMVWWWKYDRNPAGEEYSTCFEVVVHGGSSPQAIQPRDAVKPQVQQQQQEQALVETTAETSPLQPQEEPKVLEAVAASNTVALQAVSAKSLVYASEDLMLPSSADTIDSDKRPSSSSSSSSSLADMVSQADAPLKGIPSPDFHAVPKTEGYLGDDDGLLAVDAINMDSQTVPDKIVKTPSSILKGIQQDLHAQGPPSPPQQPQSQCQEQPKVSEPQKSAADVGAVGGAAGAAGAASPPLSPSPSGSPSCLAPSISPSLSPSVSPSPSSSVSSSTSSTSTSFPTNTPTFSPKGANGRTLVGEKPKTNHPFANAAVEMSQLSWTVVLASTMAFMAFLLS